jgi:hypothetical protein
VDAHGNYVSLLARELKNNFSTSLAVRAKKNFPREGGDKLDVSRTSRAFFARHRHAFPSRDKDPFDIGASKVKIGLSVIDCMCPVA